MNNMVKENTYMLLERCMRGAGNEEGCTGWCAMLPPAALNFRACSGEKLNLSGGQLFMVDADDTWHIYSRSTADYVLTFWPRYCIL